MRENEYTQKALDLIKREGILEKLEEHGKPIFLMLSGSHNFGFPSPDSDFDIRGAYYAPSDSFFALKPPKKVVFEFMSKDKMVDVSVDEIGHFTRILSGTNGNRAEWPFSQLMLYQSPDFEALKKMVQQYGISKQLFDHYMHFASDMRHGKSKQDGAKKDLYALRTYMTGIHTLEKGIVNSNIEELNEIFKEEIVDKIRKEKALGENTNSKAYDRAELEAVYQRLENRLIQAKETSKLPETPNHTEIDKYLKSFRISKL